MLLLACLVPGALYLAQPALDGSAWLGIPDRTWFDASLVLAVVHQVVGWFVFRFQLVYGLFTRLFGKHDLLAWGIIFFPLLLLRVILMVGLALADAGSLGGDRALQVTAGLALLLPVAYTGWSISKYFGVARALGGDHFRQAYREMPLVKEGIFKSTQTPCIPLRFWRSGPSALLAGSRAALASALFQHAYIWVHMYCTEEPDMRVMYGSGGQDAA